MSKPNDLIDQTSKTKKQAIFCQHGPKDEPIADAEKLSNSLENQRLAVKDLFNIKGYKNTAGNPDWYNSHVAAKHTANAVKLLIQAGAHFIGFTHTDEIAYSLEGNNIHYGAAENPKLAGHACGGSSMGSAAAVAAGLADIALGTDTGGSVRIPACYCGLFGIRPSHGVINSQGLIGLAPEFDTIGWFSQSAELLAQVGDILLPELPAEQNRLAVDTLFVCEALFDLVEPAYRASLYNALNQIKPFFKHIKTLELDKDLLNKLADTFRILQGRAITKEHGAWLEQVKPHFAPAIEQRFKMALALTEQEEERARQIQQALINTLTAQLDKSSVLFLPTTPTHAPKIGADVSNLRMQIINLTAIAGLTGSAQVHLPLTALPTEINGQTVPYGFSLLMTAGQDKNLLALVTQLSQQYSWEQV